MNKRDLVLIDTCMWAPFFNRPQSPVKRTIDGLLDDDRAALIGPLLAEVLSGIRNDAKADWVASLLRGLQYVELTWLDWREAARLGRQLAARGHVLPITDLALAAAARRLDCSVYSDDPHFDLLPDLRRFGAER
jgi:predicted nucleic acid-binding protein